MSTSPSWFDQEKFSRLVKKVGKTVPIPPPDQSGAEVENRSPGEGLAPGLASTARISLVSKPPSLMSENRALPALPRRTSPLPSIKPVFPSTQRTAPVAQPAAAAPVTPVASEPIRFTESAPVQEEDKEEAEEVKEPEETGAPSGSDSDELAEVWQKMSLLNEELAYALQERDQAQNDNAILLEQLRQAEAAAGTPATPASTGKTQEISLLTGERDSARKEYAELRMQFETLKRQEQGPKDKFGKGAEDLDVQIESLRKTIEDKNREIAALKATAAVAGGGDEKMKAEMISLREQLAKAKEDSSIAQRGLMLSQKALHETRDTLREATEGTSLSRHNFDNLKNECATLAQQNTVLQAQNDQLSRDLAAAKSKMTSRL